MTTGMNRDLTCVSNTSIVTICSVYTLHAYYINSILALLVTQLAIHSCNYVMTFVIRGKVYFHC